MEIIKATGIVRKVDNLGRVVVPKEIRNSLYWDDNTPLEMFVEGDSVILREYRRGCVFCGNAEDSNISIFSKEVCVGCVKSIKSES